MTSKITGIYKIENKINNKKYIGQSKDIHGRWKSHINELNNNKHKNDYLQNAWNKYGDENFTFTILEVCTIDQLNQLEKHYIEKYDTFNNDTNGYNLQSGGDYPIVSESTKQKMSNALKGRKVSDEHKKKICDARKLIPTSTGIYRVTKTEDKTCLQGYRWVYGYNNEQGKRIEISRINLIDLKNEIIKQGLEWIINDENVAYETMQKDLNKPKLKKHLTDNHKQKLSKYASESQYGINNPQSQYTLWDSAKCYFSKRDMFRSKKHNKNIRKVFQCKYKGYRIPLGYFHDFISCEIISSIINEEV